MAIPSRSVFQRWLSPRQSEFAGRSTKQITSAFGQPISASSAYRGCQELGLRGQRTNRTRYATFWSIINWSLPTSVLARIWNVDYGNLLARRRRLKVRPPRWRADYDASDPVFVAACDLEC